MSRASYGSRLAGPGIMLLSAAIFGYFGFATHWNYHSGLTGEFLLFVALLDWTLKGSAIAFGASALLTLANRVLGNLIYGVVGLIGAIMFVVIAGMDYADTKHRALHPLLLLIFAAWNGYSSFAGLRAMRSGRGDHGSFGPPPQGDEHL